MIHAKSRIERSRFVDVEIGFVQLEGLDVFGCVGHFLMGIFMIYVKQE
jgi:hypothetical protein